MEELRICSLIGVVKISGVLWIGASKRVIQLNVLLLVGLEDHILLILIHETTIRITFEEGIPGSTLQVLLTTQIVVAVATGLFLIIALVKLGITFD